MLSGFGFRFFGVSRAMNGVKPSSRSAIGLSGT